MIKKICRVEHLGYVGYALYSSRTDEYKGSTKIGMSTLITYRGDALSIQQEFVDQINYRLKHVLLENISVLETGKTSLGRPTLDDISRYTIYYRSWNNKDIDLYESRRVGSDYFSIREIVNNKTMTEYFLYRHYIKSRA